MQHTILAVLFLLCANLAAQTTMSIARLQQNIDKAKQQVNTVSYKVWVDRKDLSKPDWRSRFFTVYLSHNPNNFYDYDWEISEYIQGYESLILYKDTLCEQVSKQFHIIGERVEKYGLEPGEYNEVMRTWCIPNEWLRSITYQQPDTTQIQIIAPAKNDTCWQVIIQVNALQKRTVWVDTTTYFITQIYEEYADETLSATGMERFRYTHFEVNKQLPDSVLNTNYYKQTGLYKHKGNTPTSKVAPKEPPKEPFSQALITNLFSQAMLLPNNDTVYLSQLEADFYVLDFWYINCPPCRKAMPAIQKLYENYNQKGVRVIGINGIDTNNKDYAANIMVQSGFTYPLYFTTKAFLREVAIYEFPTFAIFDKNHKLLYVETGFDNTDYAKLLKTLMLSNKK